MAAKVRSLRSIVEEHHSSNVIDLVPRLSSPTLALTNRIQQLGWEILLEDQIAVLATYEWELRTRNRISEHTARRYLVQIESYLKGLGEWPLTDSIEGPVTILAPRYAGLGYRDPPY